MDIYLPIAEMSVNAFLLLMLGAVGGFLSGLFGVGGGFLLTPFLSFMGVPPSIAVGTQANQLVGTSLAGTLAHWRRRHVDVRMGTILMIGSFAGVAAGAGLFRWLQSLGHIDLVIMLGYVVMLGGIGGMMLVESGRGLWRKRNAGSGKTSAETGAEFSSQELARSWGADGRYAMDFPASGIRIHIVAPLAVGFAGGVLVSILGIGGGFMLVPAMIYVLRMPPKLISGTSLFQIIFSTAFSTLLQAVINHSVDILLAMVLLAGSVVGVPFGTRLASRMNPVVARLLLALLILAVAVKLVVDLTMAPPQPFALETKLL
ncbi:MAG: sulfite exporter TauE/SafE family protein [Alphaproteobacteria bacterium]|nr:sulfite exporter TauE/SafE family protein [Alphaproteobacteria bacterium]